MSTIESHVLLGSLLNITDLLWLIIILFSQHAVSLLIGSAESSKNGTGVTCSDGENEETNSQVIVAGIKSTINLNYETLHAII